MPGDPWQVDPATPAQAQRGRGRAAAVARIVGLVVAVGALGGLVVAALLMWVFVSGGAFSDEPEQPPPIKVDAGKMEVLQARLQGVVKELSALKGPSHFIPLVPPKVHGCGLGDHSGGEWYVTQPALAGRWRSATATPPDRPVGYEKDGWEPIYNPSPQALRALEVMANELIARGWKRGGPRDPVVIRLTKATVKASLSLGPTGDYRWELIDVDAEVLGVEPCKL